MAAPKGASSSTNLTNIPACWIYGIVCLKQVVQRKTGRNFYNIGPFARGSSSQEVRNDRTGEQDVRTMQGWCSAPQGRATRRAPATGPPMGGRRGAPLRRHFRFKNFREALHFVNKVGELAEEQGHHPDIYLGWGRVEVLVWTHKINGLTESDFVFAAKVDRL